MPRWRIVRHPVVASAAPLDAVSSSAKICHLVSRADETTQGAFLLPRHLWCLMAQFLDAADFAWALQCSAWLLAAFDTSALWLHRCLMNDFVRPVAGHNAGWIYPFCPGMRVSSCIDWRQLLQVNMRLGKKPSIWIRLQDVDLRLPVPAKTESGKALLAQLSQALTTEAGSGRLLSGLPASCGYGQEARHRWSLRLRRLQWGGRPGMVVEEGTSLLGGHFLVEWSLPTRKSWPLPPTCVSSEEEPSKKALSISSRIRYPVFSWLHGGGKGPQVIMIRVLSLLVPRELWLCVPLDATWGGLCQEIAKLLRRESPLLAELCRPITYHLMDLQRPRMRAVVHVSKPLRELFWAQSETLRVELESSSSRRLAGRGGTPGGVASGDSCLAILIWREHAFREVPEFRSDSPPVQSSFGLASPWSRTPELDHMQVSRWSRQASEPLPAAGSRLMTRQLSEPLTVAAEFEREVSEPPPLPGLPNRSWFPPTEHCLQIPEDPAMDLIVDGEQTAEPAVAEERRPGYTLLDRQGSGHTWEHVVPHYSPRLLPRTQLARQFEFHPSWPEIMLTGDKKGSVNILNTETNEVHPPLVVGMCPMLGLVWMRHHPQKAVCGASHSGKITFLHYDPHAKSSEPALHCLQTVEEFPKLSSLSINCTDDFLLASGISPNIAVYDVQTGKVLLKSQGVHEHFINISRFCHNSPHIFATASFDHTCKVWDVRLPLLRDRPVKTLNTGSHNVMCMFSPDDKYMLCSGVDTRIMQFEVPSWRQTPDHFPMREPVHRERYRRSMYLATGRHFVTAATEESHMHLMTVDGRKLGVVDFRGVVQQWPETKGHTTGSRGLTAETCCLQVPRLAMQLESGICSARMPSHVTATHRWGLAGREHTASLPHAVGYPNESLVQGTVQLDDADPNGGSSRNNHEFIQSIRTHPSVKNRVGVLLSLTQAEQSYVAVVDMDPRTLGQ
mmetsp:Transcript_83045/g.201253  ORF Transcript_83045/g.201253 Transcript_83045/m.201253 type:complete len:954 (+) Transcript_83045:63-2924(+)